MNHYQGELNQTEKRDKLIKMSIVFLIASVVLIIVIAKATAVAHYEYLKEVFVSEAQILETKTNLDSSPQQYFIRLGLINQSVTLKEDQSWFEVNDEFYQKSSTTLNF